MLRVRDTVFADVLSHDEWREEVRQGKMFGALVVTGTAEVLLRCSSVLHDIDGAKVLFAYSGQILERSDWPGYVPAIFDYLQPDGYFKRHEADITALNRNIDDMRQSAAFADALCALTAVKERGDNEIAAYKAFIKNTKGNRTVLEAQFQNAELRRVKQRIAAEVSAAQTVVDTFETEIKAMKEERHKRSCALQRWLFTQHRLALPKGEQRSLLRVFTDYACHTGSKRLLPPSGTGECCAPRLLNYANIHGLKSEIMAEFWYGDSPKGEVRHHGQFYEPCQSKCVPILWAMEGHSTPDMEIRLPDSVPMALPEVLYEDAYLIAVNKQVGMLSVPGKVARPNVEDVLRMMRPDCRFLKMIHRLDMDTGGIILAAKDPETYTVMQKMFASHSEVDKQYIAILACGEHKNGASAGDSGEITIPLSSDDLNRPRQRVDYVKGKRAVTRYEFIPLLSASAFESVFGCSAPDDVVAGNGNFRTVLLTPLTGRTHQLRLHCAHPDGLGMPILGDALYGNVAAERMFLQACRLTFRHPMTQTITTIQIPLC